VDGGVGGIVFPELGELRCFPNVLVQFCFFCVDLGGFVYFKLSGFGAKIG